VLKQVSQGSKKRWPWFRLCPKLATLNFPIKRSQRMMRYCYYYLGIFSKRERFLLPEIRNRNVSQCAQLWSFVPGNQAQQFENLRRHHLAAEIAERSTHHRISHVRSSFVPKKWVGIFSCFHLYIEYKYLGDVTELNFQRNFTPDAQENGFPSRAENINDSESIDGKPGAGVPLSRILELGNAHHNWVKKWVAAKPMKCLTCMADLPSYCFAAECYSIFRFMMFQNM